MKNLTISDVNVELIVNRSKESRPKSIRDKMDLYHDNVWIWCNIDIHIRHMSWSYTTSIHGASYESENDFKSSKEYESLLEFMVRKLCEKIDDNVTLALKFFDNEDDLLDTYRSVMITSVHSS